jgi:formyltetrahydrofolate deformylase
MPDDRAILLVQCPDRPGIVAAVSSFLFRHGANILDFDQHTDVPRLPAGKAEGLGANVYEGAVYFTRLEFDTARIDLPLDDLERAFALDVARPYAMEWRLARAAEHKRITVLASRHDHALLELLWTWKRGELRGEVSLVVSNHPDLRAAVTSFGVPFEHVPSTEATRDEAEARLSALVDGRADLLVLARYMQILSPGLVSRWRGRIINIHHSFLPAFAGADPYRQAHERGVKVVGATAHYVTEALDAGPIIEQDVARVSHRDSVEDLKRLGRDLERRVLARAVRWHCEDRVLVHGNKTVVFA